MAHFAELNEDNVVTRVVVVANKDTSDANGVEKESIGVAFCERLFGGNWKQTSYNNSIRKRYAGIGYKYHADLDAFVAPRPYPSWTLDEEEAAYVAPLPLPEDAGTGDPIKHYYWDEEAYQADNTTGWKLLNHPDSPE